MSMRGIWIIVGTVATVAGAVFAFLALSDGNTPLNLFIENIGGDTTVSVDQQMSAVSAGLAGDAAASSSETATPSPPSSTPTPTPTPEATRTLGSASTRTPTPVSLTPLSLGSLKAFSGDGTSFDPSLHESEVMVLGGRPYRNAAAWSMEWTREYYTLLFKLPDGFKTFSATIGVDEIGCSVAAGYRLSFFVDDELAVALDDPLSSGLPPVDVVVDVTRGAELLLFMEPVESGCNARIAIAAGTLRP